MATFSPQAYKTPLFRESCLSPHLNPLPCFIESTCHITPHTLWPLRSVFMLPFFTRAITTMPLQFWDLSSVTGWIVTMWFRAWPKKIMTVWFRAGSLLGLASCDIQYCWLSVLISLVREKQCLSPTTRRPWYAGQNPFQLKSLSH